MNKRLRPFLAAPFVLSAAFSPAFADTPAKKPAEKRTLPKAPEGAHVQKDAEGHCWYHHSAACPPNVHCNPGPPQEVECEAPATETKPPKKK